MNLRTHPDDYCEFKVIASFDLTQPRQRGFAFLPFLLGNWQMLAIAGLALIVMGYIGRCEYIHRDRDQMIATLKAQAEEQTKQAKLKEAADAKRIKDAMAERDLARKRLRDVRPLDLSSSPAAPTGSSEVCFGATGYNAAFSEYRESLGRSLEELRGIAIQCAEAQIDNKAWRDSWPK